MESFQAEIDADWTNLLFAHRAGSLGAGTGGSEEVLGARNRIQAPANAAAMLANQSHTPIPGGRKTARPTPPSSAGILAEKIGKKSMLKRTVTALEIRGRPTKPADEEN